LTEKRKAEKRKQSELTVVVGGTFRLSAFVFPRILIVLFHAHSTLEHVPRSILVVAFDCSHRLLVNLTRLIATIRTFFYYYNPDTSIGY